jgi:hypothetical protein
LAQAETVETLDNIERIEVPSIEEFHDKYVRQGKPVIIKNNLFQGQPISQIKTAADAVRMFGDIRLQLTQEYISAMIAEFYGRRPEEANVTMTLRQYLEFIDAKPSTRLIATENEIPDGLRLLYTYSRHALDRGNPDSRAEDFLFVANAGNVSAMHYDGPITHLLHYHIFGRKRHIMAPPRVGKKLNPVDIFSTILLHNFTNEDKLAFVRYLGGYDTIVNPGETLFMPAQTWHHVEYIDTAASFNMRWSGSKYAWFIENHVHRDMYRQNIASKMIDSRAVEQNYLQEFKMIEAACKTRYATPGEKFRAVRAVLKEVCKRICPELLDADYHFFPHHEEFEERYAVEFNRFYQD